MRTCPRCGKPNEPQATFCGTCGQLISETLFGMLDRCTGDWDKGDRWDFSRVREWIRAQPGDRVVAQLDAIGSMVLLQKRVALEVVEDWDRHGRVGKTADQVLARTKDFDATLAWIDSFPAPEVLFRDAKTGRTERVPKKVAKARINVLRGMLTAAEGQDRGDQSMIDGAVKLMRDALPDAAEEGTPSESTGARRPGRSNRRAAVLQGVAGAGQRMDGVRLRTFVRPESKLTLTSIHLATRRALLESAAFHAHALVSAFSEPRPDEKDIMYDTAEALLCGFIMGRRLLGTERLAVCLSPSVVPQQMTDALAEYPIREALEAAGKRVSGAIGAVARARSLRALWLRISDRQLAALSQFELLTKGLALALVEVEMSLPAPGATE